MKKFVMMAQAIYKQLVTVEAETRQEAESKITIGDGVQLTGPLMFSGFTRPGDWECLSARSDESGFLCDECGQSLPVAYVDASNFCSLAPDGAKVIVVKRLDIDAIAIIPISLGLDLRARLRIFDLAMEYVKGVEFISCMACSKLSVRVGDPVKAAKINLEGGAKNE